MSEAATADVPPTPTVAALLCRATRLLRGAGIERPRAEARLLVAHALGRGPAELIAHRDEPLDDAAAALADALIARRASREPAAYILGRREFWGMDLRVSPATLIPRPESETLIEAAIAAFADRAAVRRILDLGTGSGCLLLAALLEFPGATGIGVESSPAALRVAEANAAALGLARRAAFTAGDWVAGITGRFDLVLANPPYVACSDAASRVPELMHEPAAALFAGADGLAAYRAILPGLDSVLAPGGIAILELGAGQADAVSALADAAGLRPSGLRHDLAGIPRAIVLRGLPSPAW